MLFLNYYNYLCPHRKCFLLAFKRSTEVSKK